MENKVCGEFPEFCYKAFDCKKYAEDFIYRGTFRMGCRFSYTAIKDKSRCDPTEGYGHTKEPGTVTVGLVSTNPAEKTIWTREQGLQEHHPEFGDCIFYFCTCLPDVDPGHMSEMFGKYIVTINDPKQLAKDIKDYFINDGWKFVIVGCKVVYKKGQKLEEKLTDNERLDMAYKQKPESFRPKSFRLDCEFRIVAIKLGKACKDECKFLSGQFDKVEPECKFIKVNLNKPLNYLSLD